MFCNLQMTKSEMMQQHISALDDIVQQLFAIGVNYPDDEITMTLLDSLPESYDNLIVILEGIDDITSDYVKTRLLQEEAHKKQSVERGNATTLMSKSKRRKQPTDKNSTGPKCFYCK